MKRLLITIVVASVAILRCNAASLPTLAPEASGAETAVPTDVKGTADSASTPAVNGKYIFIPDSIQDDVIRLLRGRSKVVDDINRLDPNEKTIWKNDTVNMVIRSRNLGRYDRGLSNFLYVPKGSWKVGLTASYGQFNSEDLELLGLVNDVDLGVSGFSIKPYFAYFVRNNISVGMRFGYTTLKGNIDSFKVDIDDDMNFSLHDISYNNESYTAAFTATQYIGITRRGRFGVFNEMELAFTSGSSDFKRPYGGEPRITHTNYTEAAINISPGVSVFIMKNVSFNISFGVFGFHLRHEKQSENGVSTGNRTTSGANFRFNIFNINFGLGVHF